MQTYRIAENVTICYRVYHRTIRAGTLTTAFGELERIAERANPGVWKKRRIKGWEVLGGVYLAAADGRTLELVFVSDDGA